MKNISFDNPYLLFIAIPFALVVILPFFIVGNKDNRSLSWKLSIVLHMVMVTLVTLAVAGLRWTTVLTKTTVYVVADVSYSTTRDTEQIDAYIAEIEQNLPENSKLGVVCFAKNVVLLTPAGREIKSVNEANVDDSATDIAGALNYTEGLFKEDSIKRIILITDGNDTVSDNVSSIASTVLRLKQNDIKVDTIFMNTAPQEGETEVQLSQVEFSKSTYIGHTNRAKFTINASQATNVVLELYGREQVEEGTRENEYEKIDYTVLFAEEGENHVTMMLPASNSGTYEYTAKVVADGDMSTYNNARSFTQEVVGKTNILLVTGSANDRSVLEVIYGGEAEIDTYLVSGANTDVPFTLEQLIEYDEIVVSNVDIRDLKNVNAFIDSLDIVVSQYGKSLITFGDLRIQTDAEDMVFKKFKELLPVSYGNNKREGRLYTIVLDVSDSMFMASKFTTAKESAIKLLSILGDDDYVCLVTFSGEIKMQTPKKAGACRQDLISYIDSLTTGHGTDLGLGLEEALKTVQALRMEENQIMIISDGFSFDSERAAVTVARDLYNSGAVISAINTYFAVEGTGGASTLKSVVNAGKGGNYYEIIRPEDVEKVVFGTIADDIGDVIIYADSNVNVVRYNDPIVQGISSLPNVSAYIISVETYDAVVPLTISYLKPGGYTETVPLYAYRAHGNGRVSSFTSDFMGGWTRNWLESDKSTFIHNMLNSNTPKERNDVPFTINDITPTDREAYIEITPTILDPDATTTLKITSPNGRTITRDLAFDSTKYSYTLELTGTGTYTIEITYKYEDKTYVKVETFDIPYLSEYNAFVSCDTSVVYKFMRGEGGIYEGKIPDLKNDKSEISTYQESYKIPLLIAAICVFVADILVRKLTFKKKGTKKVKEKGNENS